jgi:hypothetical protein
MASAHQAKTIFLVSFNSIILALNTIQSYHCREIRVINGKSIVLSPEKMPRKVGRKLKWSHTDAVLTPSTVSLSLKVELVCRLFQVVNIKRVILQHHENTQHGRYLHHTNFSSEDILQSPEASVFCKLL